MERKIQKERRTPIVVIISIALFLALASVIILPASATTVSISIGDIFVKPGENAATQIMIDNVTNLGVADINLTFDSSVVHVVSVTNSDFDFFHAVIDNSTGIVRIGGVDYGDGLSGNVKLAGVTLKAVGEHSETSALDMSINELKEAGAVETPLPAIVDNGTAFINLPPVAIAVTLHRYNSVGSEYPCKAFFNASASYDPDGDAITNYNWDFGDGYSGECLTTEHVYSCYKWNGTGYEPFNVNLTVKDAEGLINTATMHVNVFIAGDANGDGRVNILDAVIVGREWGEKSTCGDYCWEEQERADRGDLNNDCEVNILDAVIIGANWGHTTW
jgi:hypothetical protein